MRNFIAKLFIKTINPFIKVNPYYGEGSAYSFTDKTIHLNLRETNGEDEFLNHLALEHKCSFVNEFPLELWTILHELGHHYTEDDVLNPELDYFARVAINNADPSSYENNQEVANAYFNLESEWRATEWAIRYAKKHPLKCLIFGDLLRQTFFLSLSAVRRLRLGNCLKPPGPAFTNCLQFQVLTFIKKYGIIYTERKKGNKTMTQKNKEKEERKARRKPPIPYTRKTPTKREMEIKKERKYKNYDN